MYLLQVSVYFLIKELLEKSLSSDIRVRKYFIKLLHIFSYISDSECKKSYPSDHQRTHTGEKPLEFNKKKKFSKNPGQSYDQRKEKKTFKCDRGDKTLPQNFDQSDHQLANAPPPKKKKQLLNVIYL